MAAPSDERSHLPQQQQVEEEVQVAGFPQPPPCGTAGAAPERSPDGGQVWRRRGRRRWGELSRLAVVLSLRSLRLCQRLLSHLLQWFAAWPLGQRALEGAIHTLAAAERAIAWAAGTTAHCPVPFAWFFMMPVVMVLMVVQTGADLAERYLDVELPDNRQLVKWLEGLRVELERFQVVTTQNISTQAVDQQVPSLGFLNRWAFNIPYGTAQKFGDVPVQVDKQPSDTDAASVTVRECGTAPTMSESSTLMADEAQAVPSSGELTPPPESDGDKSLYFSPEAHKTAKEQAESEAQQDNTQEEAEGEKAQEGKLTPPPESAGDKSLYFSPEAHKTAKEQAESEAQQDNTQEEAEGEKAQEEKIKEEAVDVAEEARVMLALHDQPRDLYAVQEDISALFDSEFQGRTDGATAVSDKFAKRLRELLEEQEQKLLEQCQSIEAARGSSDTPQEGQSLEAGHSAGMGGHQQKTPSHRRYNKAFWDEIFSRDTTFGGTN